MNETTEKLNWQRLAITAGIVLVTAAAVGGTVWYLMDQNAKSVADSNAKSISALQKQVDGLNTKVKTGATAANTTTTSDTNSLSPITLDPLAAKVGDKFGGMTLASLSATPPDAGNLLGNTSAVFTGKVTVKVEYSYTAPGEPSMFGEFLSFTVEDQGSLLKMPVLKNDSRNVWFGLANQSEIARLKPLLGLGAKGVSGTATLVIDNYHISYAPTEVFNTATIISVQ